MDNAKLLIANTIPTGRQLVFAFYGQKYLFGFFTKIFRIKSNKYKKKYYFRLAGRVFS